MNGSRILAVDPGRSTLGVAVFEGASLRYYAVKTLRVPGTPEEVRRAAARVMSTLIVMFRPTRLAIEQPLVVQQRAELLAHVIGSIKTTARRRGLIVGEYAPQVVRRFICPGVPALKREVSRMLSARYPELGRYYEAQTMWGRLYYEKMFGAVAVGLMALAMGDQKQATEINKLS